VTVHVPATSPSDGAVVLAALAGVVAAALGTVVADEAPLDGAAVGRLSAAVLSPRRTWS